MIMNCNPCLTERRKVVFKAPYDDVGVTLMKQHLQTEHDIPVSLMDVNREWWRDRLPLVHPEYPEE